MNRFKLVMAVFFIVTMIIYLVPPLGGTAGDVLGLVLFQAFSVLVVGVGIYSLRVFGFKGFRSMTILLITSGVLMWSIGDTIWGYEQIVVGEIGFPSAADYFYLLGYPMIFWAAISDAIGSKLSFRKLPSGTKMAMLLAAVLLVGAFAYLGVYNIYDSEASGGENLVLIGYGVGDIFLVVASLLVLVMANSFGNSVVGRFWKGMLLGVGVTLLADIFYGIFTDPYIDGEALYAVTIDGLYILGYVFMANALWDLSIASKKIQEKLNREVRKG
jgi:hypothetical protein